MKQISVPMFETSDGKRFEDQKTAEEHEARVNAKGMILSLLLRDGVHAIHIDGAGAFADFVTNHLDLMGEILSGIFSTTLGDPSGDSQGETGTQSQNQVDDEVLNDALKALGSAGDLDLDDKLLTRAEIIEGLLRLHGQLTWQEIATKTGFDPSWTLTKMMRRKHVRKPSRAVYALVPTAGKSQKTSKKPAKKGTSRSRC